VASYSQTERPLKITTPLGPDILLLRAFQGHEEMSRLFGFHVDMVADQKDEVRFDQIIGQSVTIEMRLMDDSKRYFNGIVNRFSQAQRDETFVHFRASIVPKFWLLSKITRSRVFQQHSVPDILKLVLLGFDVNYDITGTYYKRDYVVQYRESDFDFASRLMEEEGIYYFFKHTDGNHQMMVSDNTSKHPVVPGQGTAIYEELSADVRSDMRVSHWEKIQELRSGECTLWDHTFELPTNHLEAKEKTIVAVPVGKVVHKLNLANDALEIYDYPGRYAQRFDSVDPSGGNRPADIAHTFADRMRAVRLRMEQEEVLGIRIEGKSDCGNFSAGHKFTLDRHFDADAGYLLMRVEHEASDESYRSDQPDTSSFSYQNRFTCIPETLRYRPQLLTPVPVIQGTQTATVTGPAGEEIWVDKYGRVKVQFHWDREGKMDANSSCWVRVAQVWAGKSWGAFFWPRIGHEVVVAFEEGDPDQPLIIGSVYNADNMPWYVLPKNKELAGFKSASVRGTAHQNYNGIVFNDEKGKEHLSIHSEHNLSLNSEKDKMIHAGANKGERVGVANTFTVGKILPIGGGSGGGFDEGNSMPDPPPLGVVGVNSTMVYGDNFQGAMPMNHQMVIGNNLQMCINPCGLAAGVPGLGAPLIMQALAGSGMGGSMQFTVGASAQFTLGQTFEISLGPPKIEIHTVYNDMGDLAHKMVVVLCGVLSAFSIVFTILYDLMKDTNAVEDYKNATNDQQKAAALASERSGEKERAALILIYQLVCDAMLVAILAVEAVADADDWNADNTMKELYRIDEETLNVWHAPTVATDPKDSIGEWSETGVVVAGMAGVVAAIEAEILLIGSE
jgi:type VI secretion system secreted protein VgrG